MIKTLRRVAVLLILLILFLVPTKAKASLFDDFLDKINSTLRGGVDDVKTLGKPRADKNVTDNSLTVQSDITLVPNGDANKNGEMDGGDTVRFSFIISNGTDKQHPFSSLKTNIKRDSIHFIHNVKGVTGIDNSTLELPNINVAPNSKLEISFDAKLNYSGEEEIVSGDLAAKTPDAAKEKEISSQPLLEDNKKKKLSEGIKKIKKFKAAAFKNGFKTTLKNNQQEGTSSAVVVIVPSASPSAREEASASSELQENPTASPSAQVGGDENAN